MQDWDYQFVYTYVFEVITGFHITELEITQKVMTYLVHEHFTSLDIII